MERLPESLHECAYIAIGSWRAHDAPPAHRVSRVSVVSILECLTPRMGLVPYASNYAKPASAGFAVPLRSGTAKSFNTSLV
jgi:hypothetical protein